METEGGGVVELGATEKLKAKVVFDRYDLDKNGRLSKEEVLPLVKELMRARSVYREKETDPEILENLTSQYLQGLDKDKSGDIDFAEFLTLYANLIVDFPAVLDDIPDHTLHPKPGVMYSIHVMEAPLFKAKFGDALHAAEAYHTGLRLVNEEDEKDVFEMDYSVVTTVLGSIMPDIIKVGGKRKLLWRNHAKCKIYTELPVNYWVKDSLVGKVRGEGVEKLFDHVREYNDLNHHYVLWEIQVSSTDSPMLRSYNCADWVDSALAKLAELGAEWMEGADRKRDKITLYASNVIHVDQEDPATMQQILKFFKKFTKLFNQLDASNPLTVIAAQSRLAELAASGVYIYHRKNYYLLYLEHPYLSFSYVPVPLPLTNENGNKK